MRFETRNISITLEGLPLELSLVTNVDELMERLLAKGDDHEDVRDERIPYWADLWPSAIALSRFLIREKIIQPGMQVLEIGCGLALPGIVAGKLGADVVLTDYLPEALELARRNLSRNIPGREAGFELLDWRTPRRELAADLVLASDVAYETRAFDPLPNAFKTLCRPGGQIIISEPDRAMARAFLQALTLEGFFKEHTLINGRYDNLDYLVNIYHFRDRPFQSNLSSF